MHLVYHMDLGDKSWKNFLGFTKYHKGWEYEAYRLHESRRFSVTSLELLGLQLTFSRILRRIEKSVTFSLTPYYLRGSQPNALALCEIINMTHILGAIATGTESLLSRALEPHQNSWMRVNSFELKDLGRIVQDEKNIRNAK